MSQQDPPANPIQQKPTEYAETDQHAIAFGENTPQVQQSEAGHIQYASSIRSIHSDDWGVYFQSSGFEDEQGQSDLSRCEDAEPLLFSLKERASIFACVADGLGGYSQGFDGKSGGYIASRAASEVIKKFFLEYRDGSNTKEIASHLTRHVMHKLLTLQDRLPKSRIKGLGISHKLATTFAGFSWRQRGSRHGVADFYWIGDSRIYFLDEFGLYQLSQDDAKMSVDAFTGLTKDSPMSQFLAATQQPGWHIHSRQSWQVPNPGVMIACTDGCFDYWKGPWEFEHALVNAMEKADDWTDWLRNVRDHVDNVKRDDASMVACPVGFVDSANGSNTNARCFQRFKALRSPRYMETALYHALSLIEVDASVPGDKVWENYRTSYEKYLPKEVCCTCPQESSQRGKPAQDMMRTGTSKAAFESPKGEGSIRNEICKKTEEARPAGVGLYSSLYSEYLRSFIGLLTKPIRYSCSMPVVLALLLGFVVGVLVSDFIKYSINDLELFLKNTPRAFIDTLVGAFGGRSR